MLQTIIFVTVHGMNDLRWSRTDTECKFLSKCVCVTGSFIFSFKVRRRNWNLYFPIRCAHAQQYFPCTVLDLVTLRSPHMGRKSYIPCACREKVIFRISKHLSKFDFSIDKNYSTQNNGRLKKRRDAVVNPCHLSEAQWCLSRNEGAFYNGLCAEFESALILNMC